MSRNMISHTQARKNNAMKALQSTIDAVQVKNTGVREEEVMDDVTQTVEDVRQERYSAGIGEAENHQSG